MIYIRLCRESHKIVCSAAHICNKFYAKMCTSKHCTNKNKIFLYLPGMDSTNIKLVPCSILDFLSVQLLKHLNEIPSFAQTFKRVSYSLTLTK